MTTFRRQLRHFLERCQSIQPQAFCNILRTPAKDIVALIEYEKFKENQLRYLLENPEFCDKLIDYFKVDKRPEITDEVM